VEPALPHLDFFLPSVAEARKISGEEEPSRIAAFALARGVKALGLKLGDEGCYLRSRDVEVTIPPFQVVAQDATGAGDSWVAGFLTGILHGWDLAEVGRFANAVGAMCVTRIGATTGIGTIAETQDFMRRTPIVAR
jgi:sugar/nucleoside kinase (ribokinase family)